MARSKKSSNKDSKLFSYVDLVKYMYQELSLTANSHQWEEDVVRGDNYRTKFDREEHEKRLTNLIKRVLQVCLDDGELSAMLKQHGKPVKLLSCERGAGDKIETYWMNPNGTLSHITYDQGVHPGRTTNVSLERVASDYMYHSWERRNESALVYARDVLVKQVADNIFNYVTEVSRPQNS